VWAVAAQGVKTPLVQFFSVRQADLDVACLILQLVIISYSRFFVFASVFLALLASAFSFPALSFSPMDGFVAVGGLSGGSGTSGTVSPMF
jgi:hypothetical protein